MADVAKRAGVSTATVSRVLSETAPVASETAERVRAAIAELSYRPHPAAQVLAGRQTKTLGLFLPELSGSYFAPVLRGVESEARQNGISLLVFSNAENGSTPVPTSYPLGEHNTIGLLVFTDSLPDAELARLHGMHFPVVLMHRPSPDDLNIPCVTVENEAGARELVNHLIETHDCRRIAFLRGPEGNEDSYWRKMGYISALESHGIAFDPSLVTVGGFNEKEAHAAVALWLEQGIEFDAIFTGDDDAATGTISALLEAGKRVPADVLVGGFDDVPLSRHLNPPLTTVRSPIEMVGREAVRQLLRLIRQEPVESTVLLPTELIIRRSCGCG